jgi:hypothetical protein
MGEVRTEITLINIGDAVCLWGGNLTTRRPAAQYTVITYSGNAEGKSFPQKYIPACQKFLGGF